MPDDFVSPDWLHQTFPLRDSPVVGAVLGHPTRFKVLEQELEILKLARGESPTLRGLFGSTSSAQGLPQSRTLGTVLGDSGLDALMQPSLIARLDETLASAEAGRTSQALLLATATYEDLLQTAALSAPASDNSAETPLVQDFERDADRAAAELLGLAGLDGVGRLGKVKQTVRMDLAHAIAAVDERAPGSQTTPRDVLRVTVDLGETNALLRQLIAKAEVGYARSEQPSNAESHPDLEPAGEGWGRTDWIAFWTLVVAILALAIAVAAWQFPVTPPPVR